MLLHNLYCVGDKSGPQLVKRAGQPCRFVGWDISLSSLILVYEDGVADFPRGWCNMRGPHDDKDCEWCLGIHVGAFRAPC